MPDSLIKTAFTPEDWEGLTHFAQKSEIKDKDRILEIAQSDLHPDTKEQQLKRLGETYLYMSMNWFPALRHSDYEIEYVLPNFTPEQARIMVKQDPSQLSLFEMYSAAQLCEINSAEYYEIMEISVGSFPDSQEANLNAAAMELERGNLEAAKKYLKKADMSTSAAQNNMKRIVLLEEEQK